MRRHKQGGYLDAMNMVVMIPTFILIAFGIGVVVYGVLNDDLDTSEFDRMYVEAYTSQLINTPNCFAYENPQTKRVDYNTVDIRKLTNQRFIECLLYGEPQKQMRAKMTVTYLDTDEEETFVTSTWFEGAYVKDRETRKVTVITDDLKKREALIRVYYSQIRMEEP